MSILISVLLIVEVLSAFLLIVVILAQKSKDQGLGMAFGGGMGESLFGSRAGNVLTRMTIGLAVIFMLTTMALGYLFANSSRAGSSVMNSAEAQAPLAPAVPAAPVAAPEPIAAPMMPVAEPAPMAAPAEPMVMEVTEEGSLEEVEAPSEATETGAASGE